MNKNVILIQNQDSELNLTEKISNYLYKTHDIEINIVNLKDSVELDKSSLVLLYLNYEEIKWFLKKHISSELLIGIIPNKQCTKVMRSYGISNDIFEAIDDAINEKNSEYVDILLCNGELTFNEIIIGDVHGLNQYSTQNENLYKKIKSFFSNLKNLTFRDYALVTAKEHKIQTAATGIMILEHNTNGVNKNLINENLSLHDGKLNALILAPSSIISYLYYLLMAFFYHRFSINKLPKSIGIVATSKLEIKSSKPMDFVMDGIGVSSKVISLEVVRDALHVQLGRLIPNMHERVTIDDDKKEVIKVSSLPKGEMKNLLINEPVPIFKKAAEDDFKELFLGLKQNAVLSSAFVILMVLSTLLATTGLFQNSAPVIIGAMILAPLMAPIISLSMGVARGDQFLLKESLYTLIIGVSTAIAFSSIFTFMMPLESLTSEMSARLNPNILDLMVAVISGIAGAYANSKSQIAKSLAGVAIAVALVPPLSVTGIGIGFGNYEVIYGSFLLFITNLVGITLAASLTFLVLGYAPIYRAKKGIVYTTILLAIVTVPLVASFMMVLKQNDSISKLEGLKNITIDKKEISLNVLSVDLSGEKPNISLEVHSSEMLKQSELIYIKSKIESVIKEPVILSVTPKVIMY